MKILMTPDQKKVVITPDKDICLYDAPHNPPNTGTTYTTGVDLFAHKARSGKMYFYTYSWSMWQGSPSCYELITEDRAKDFIVRKAGMSEYGLSKHEMEQAERIWPDIFEETA